MDFSKHALEQMKTREISLKIAQSVLDGPQQIITETEKKIYQSIINFDEEDGYLIRVFVNIDKDPNNVITVYRTSKIKKYYEG